MTTKYINRPFHYPVYQIITDCKQLISDLSLQYGTFLQDEMSEEYTSVSVIKQEHDRYLLACNGIQLQTDAPLHELVKVLYDTTRFDNNIFALHGAAVEYNKKATIFLAATTTGKTTLTSYLTQNGFGYITDDCILLNKADFKVHPYPCPIHLREGGVEVLKRYNCLPKDLKYLDAPYVHRIIYSPKNVVATPLPTDSIYFLSRNETENKCVQMNMATAIAHLMKAPITTYPVTSGYLKFLSTLAQHGCKQLYYKDMEFVTEIIKQGK